MAKSTQSAELYYNFNPALSSYYATVFSYAQNAESPILLTRYAHEQIFPNHYVLHNHDDWCSLFIFLSGNFGFLINGHLYTPRFGDAVLVRSQEKYTSIFPTASYVDYYQFCFPTELLEKTKDTNLFMDLFYGKNSHSLISPGDALAPKIIEHLRSLEKLSETNDSYRDIIMYSHVIQIAAKLRSAAKMQSPSFSDSKAPKKLDDAILYMHKNFTTIEGSGEVAKNCGISGTYLSRMFSKHLSCTPNEYITKLRISYAKYLLSDGESITDTCYKSGFNNYTYFISKFKQISGHTPSEFRKRNT